MGLDGVEILLAVEDHFGIAIRDSEAESIRTVGDLISLIQNLISAGRVDYCPTLPAFLALRKETRAVLRDEALRIRPRDKVVDALGPRERRVLWTRLADLLGTTPRTLRRPLALRWFLAGLSAVLLVIAVASAMIIDLQIMPLTLFLAACMIGCLNLVTLPSRLMPPKSWESFGEITTRIVGVEVATKLKYLRNVDEILAELRPLIVSILGVQPSEVVPSARFVEDLDMG